MASCKIVDELIIKTNTYDVNFHQLPVKPAEFFTRYTQNIKISYGCLKPKNNIIQEVLQLDDEIEKMFPKKKKLKIHKVTKNFI